MKKVEPEKIRNIAVVGHGGCGKTTLVEGLLFASGQITRFGKVEDGTTISDYDPEEIKRKISINTALAFFFYKDFKINLIDTPGYADFIGEVVSALSATDSLLFVIDAASGVQVQTEKIWHMAQEELPRAFFINRLDKEGSDFSSAVESIKSSFQKVVVPLQIPVGKEANLKGIIDLLEMKAIIYENQKPKEADIPQELKGEAESSREKLIEAAAESSDELLEKYLEGGGLTKSEILEGLKKSFSDGKIIPIFSGSATQLIGVHSLLDFIINLFPSPLERKEIKGINPKTKEEITKKIAPSEPLVSLVFKTMTDPYVGKLNYVRVFSGTLKTDSHLLNATKDRRERVGHLYMMRGKNQEDVGEVVSGDITTIPKLTETATGDTLCDESSPIVLTPPNFPEPVFSVAIEPKTKGDEEKLSTCLTKLAEEDLTLKVYRNHETKQTIVTGLGDLHLEILLSHLQRKFNVEAILLEPRIPYKETIKSTASAQGKYKRQTGGRGQYGDVWLKVEPLPRGAGFEFVDKIVGGVVPKNYIPAVEKGIKEAMEGGVLAGYPMIDIRVTLYDGSFHPVDSSDMAFKIAGSLGFKKATQEAGLTLLEPIMNLEVMVPEKYMGDVIGNLSGKRGKIQGMETRGKYQLVKALVPLAELSKYATELRSLTHGEGAFSMEFSHYEEVPFEIAQKIVEKAQKEKAE